MKQEQVITALKAEGYDVRVDHPFMAIVASEGIHNVAHSREVIDDEPVERIVEKTKREIARLKEVAQ